MFAWFEARDGASGAADAWVFNGKSPFGERVIVGLLAGESVMSCWESGAGAAEGAAGALFENRLPNSGLKDCLRRGPTLSLVTRFDWVFIW